MSANKLKIEKFNKKKLGQTAMSTVYFFKGSLPDNIALKDCGFPLKCPIENSFSALYGNISKRIGVKLAKEYADMHGLNFTSIDFNFQFDNQIDTAPSSLEQLKNAELISLKRLSKKEIAELYKLYVNPQDISKKNVYSKLIENPDLLSKFINHPDYGKLKLVICPGVTSIGELPLTLGSIPYRYWHHITSARCSLHPNTKITLQKPIIEHGGSI